VSAGSRAFLRGTGSLFGVAIPRAVFNIRFAQLLPTISSSAARSKLANGKAYSRASTKFTHSFGDKAQVEIVLAFTQSLKSVWIVFAVVAGAGFALTWLEKEYKMSKDLNTAYGLKLLKSNTTSEATTAVNIPAPSAPGSESTTPAAEVENTMEMKGRGEDIV
jgi:hypothetical protein